MAGRKDGKGRNENGKGCVSPRKDGRWTAAYKGKVTTAKTKKRS